LLYSIPKNALSARLKSNANANLSDTGKPKSGSRELTSPPVDDVNLVALLWSFAFGSKITPSIGAPENERPSNLALAYPPSLLNELEIQTFGNLPTNLPYPPLMVTDSTGNHS
jgi:hypothetical protein